MILSSFQIWVTLARSSSFTCPEHIGCTISSKPSRVHASGLMKDKGHILLSQSHVEGNRGQDSEMLYMHFLLWANLQTSSIETPYGSSKILWIFMGKMSKIYLKCFRKKFFKKMFACVCQGKNRQKDKSRLSKYLELLKLGEGNWGFIILSTLISIGSFPLYKSSLNP